MEEYIIGATKNEATQGGASEERGGGLGEGGEKGPRNSMSNVSHQVSHQTPLPLDRRWSSEVGRCLRISSIDRRLCLALEAVERIIMLW